MTEPPRDQNSLSAVFLRSLSRKFSLGVILIGIVVILSWIFDIPLLKTVLPQLPTMKVNAAVCSVLAGVALRGWHQHFKVQNLKSQRKTQCLIFSCAFLIILISSLTLFEYGFNVDLGIDQLLFQQPEPVGSLAVPGRMAPNTAFAFLLVGSALLLRSDRRPGICLAQAMAIITWLISFVGLLGHVYGSVYFYTAGSYTGMAIHAAISLQLLSIGILCALPHSGFMPLITSGGAGSMMMRRLLPLAIALPLLVGGLSVLGHHLHLYSDRVEDVLFGTLNILVFSGLVGWNAEVLNRVDDRRRRAEQALQQVNAELEQRIEERTLALTRSQQQLRAIVEAEPECVKIITADGILKSINPSGLAIVEADSVEQALEQCIFPLIDPDYRQVFVEFTQQVANGKAGILEFEGTGLKGTHRWLESHAVPLFMPDEATPLVLAVTRDITERKQAEIALRQSEERLRLILQNMPVMLDALDETWNIIVWNQECERVTGFLADEVINNPTIMEQFYPDAAYLEQMMAVWVERGNNYRNWEWDITCKDGSTRTISWSNISDLFPVAGWAAWGVGVDVTDRKRVEAEIRQLNTELEQRVAERTVELQESNNRLQQYANDIADLYNNAPCGYHSLDAEGTIIQINNTELNWLGYNREELLNLKKFSELLTPESLRVFQENFPKFKQRGYVSDLEFEVIRKNGSTLHISLNGIAIRDAAGNYLMSRSSLFDVSERKRAETERRQIEAALRHSERQFRHAFEDASIGMAIVSLDGHWVKVNPALCQIIGYSEAELLKLTFQDITHPDDLAADLKYVHQLLAGEISTYQMEKRYFHQQGQVVWILLNVSLIRNEQGKPLHFISQIQDISDRNRAEASLRRYERIVAATTDAICLLDRNYTHQIVNQAYLDWHGLPLEQIMGHSPRAFLDSELFETRVLPDFERCLAGETIQTQLWIDYLTTGRKFVSTTLSPYYETDQTVSGMNGT